jgi:LysR family transcriptional regulator, putative pyruvate carboxylase regulator
MNLKQLEIFHHFCRFKNVSRTAEYLHVTQPAISQQLSAFESEAGVKLFCREANEYRLTETGEELFLLSKPMFLRLGQIEDVLRKARKGAADRLTIGTTKAYAHTIMPDLIAKFQEKHPYIQVHLSEGNSADLLNRLRSRKEDLVVVARTKYSSGFKAVPFAKADFTLVARPDHHLVLKSPVSIKSLSGESMIIREHGSGCRKAILERLHQFGVTPSMLVESESLGFILAYVERKKGLSFILTHEVEKELAAGTLKEIILTEGHIGFQSDIVVRRGEPASLPMKQFLKIAVQAHYRA